MTTVLDTVTRSPSKGGTRALRNAAAMQPPVAVPANGGPPMLALVTRPDGANVTTTLATPEGSPSLRQEEACAAPLFSAAAARARSKGPEGSSGGAGAGEGSVLTMGSAGFSSAGRASASGADVGVVGSPARAGAG